MKKITALVVTALSLFYSSAYAYRPVALVWAGQGVCAPNCAEAAANIARKAGFKVRLVNEKDFSDELLGMATLWIQPGGDAIEASKAFGPARMASLRNFVSRGGRYVGFCAGAFFTDVWVDDANTISGLGITPVVTADFAKETLGTKDVMLTVNWMGNLRHIYFSEGATFRPETMKPGVEVFATYETPNLPQTPAAWENKFGMGRVVVSGMHPEAPRSWKENMVDPDGDDFDLASEMITRAMAP